MRVARLTYVRLYHYSKCFSTLTRDEPDIGQTTTVPSTKVRSCARRDKSSGAVRERASKTTVYGFTVPYPFYRAVRQDSVVFYGHWRGLGTWDAALDNTQTTPRQSLARLALHLSVTDPATPSIAKHAF